MPVDTLPSVQARAGYNASFLLPRDLRAPPLTVVSGSGIHLRTRDGRAIIDASGGAAVACLGHGHARVVAAIERQARQLSYAHTGFFVSEAAENLAELLLSGAPGGLSRAYFVSSGSEAMEAALKLARQYWVEAGQPQRRHFIARRQSYHGNTLGALAVSGHVARREIYEPILAENIGHVSPCHAYRGREPGEDDPSYVARLAAELEQEFQRLGPTQVAAFVAETVVGATIGCAPPVPGYFHAVRQVCDRHGALLILDEVMCGMGRTGTTHAWEQEQVAPDLQTVAKGLGGGYQPIGAVLIGRKLAEAIGNGSGIHRHGHTYQSHPVACAAALEVQRVIREQNLLENVGRAGAQLRDTLHARLAGHPIVGDIRGRGLFLGIEFVSDPEKRTPFAPVLAVAERVKSAAMERGVAIYPGTGTADGKVGDHVLLAPPYTVEPDDIDEIVSRVCAAITAVAGELGKQ